VLTLSTHRALELLVGLVLATVPLALGVGGIVGGDGAGIVVCVVVGVVLATLALSSDHEGRSLAGSAHATVDRLLCGVLAIAAVVLVAEAQVMPAVLCAAAAIAEAILTLRTRYVVRPGRDDESRATTVTAS
jgi:hypothetical protein